MPDWLPALLVAVAGLVPALLAYRQAVRANRASSDVETRRIDAAAYERARELYEAGIGQLEEQIARLRATLSEERQECSALRERMGALEERNTALEETVTTLRRRLVVAGLAEGSA